MRLMVCFGVVVLLVILDSLSKALASGEQETKRNTWLKGAAKHYGMGPGQEQDFNRAIRWNSPKPIARIPRAHGYDGMGQGGQQNFNRAIRWNSPKPLARIPRAHGVAVDDANPSFNRAISLYARRGAPQLGKFRPPRSGMDTHLNDKYLQEMSRRALEQDTRTYGVYKRSAEDTNKLLMDAVIDLWDAKNTYTGMED